MTSKERKEGRYQRRVAKRLKKKFDKLRYSNDYDSVFSYENLYKAYKHCRKGVAWKTSVQKYITQAPLEVYKTYLQLQAGRYKSPGFYEFDLYERGKRRHIQSTSIRERVVQNCLCDNCLIPALQPSFIYDNGASMKNKGYTFAINRITEALRKHYRRYGQKGYVLVFDFSKFFDHVSHRLVKMSIAKKITDERLKQISSHFIDAFGDIGLGLGSQISQVLALASANRLDHFVKEMCKIKGYARYMDDGYLFFLTKTGKVIRKIYKRSVVKQRQKLKKLRKKLDKGLLDFQDICNSFQSWKAYASNFNAYFTVKNMEALFRQLFYEELQINAIYQNM